MNTSSSKLINYQRALEHHITPSLEGLTSAKAIVRMHNFAPFKVLDQIEL
jgi:hypothetical protein